MDEYFTYQVACPFLENESCSIHESRPIACREYLVTSSPEYCSSAKGEGIENVQHLFKVKEAVISLGGDKLPRELPYVPMIKASGMVGAKFRRYIGTRVPGMDGNVFPGTSRG